MKNTAIFVFFKSENAFNPNALTKECLSAFPGVEHLGRVNEYNPRNNDAAEAT